MDLSKVLGEFYDEEGEEDPPTPPKGTVYGGDGDDALAAALADALAERRLEPPAADVDTEADEEPAPHAAAAPPPPTLVDDDEWPEPGADGAWDDPEEAPTEAFWGDEDDEPAPARRPRPTETLVLSPLEESLAAAREQPEQPPGPGRSWQRSDDDVLPAGGKSSLFRRVRRRGG
jgi:hypothetical protein